MKKKLEFCIKYPEKYMFLYFYNCDSILTNGPENHVFPLNVADGHIEIRTDGQLVSQTSFATKINIFRK